MGFARDIGKFALSPALSILGSGKKKKPTPPPPVPTMISNTPYSQPMSMIGSQRGGY